MSEKEISEVLDVLIASAEQQAEKERIEITMEDLGAAIDEIKKSLTQVEFFFEILKEKLK